MEITNYEQKIFTAHTKVNEISNYIKENSNELSAHEAEKYIYHAIMQIGKSLLECYFSIHNEKEEGKQIEDNSGKVYKRHNKENKDYYSIFGKICLLRQTYWRKGEGSIVPLDIACNMPEKSYSYFLQDVMNILSVTDSFEDSSKKLKRMFGLEIYNRPLAETTRASITNYDKYYDDKLPPLEKSEGELQVLSYDGKGVPMIKKEAAKLKGRQGKGEKRQKKKEALVGVSYTVDKNIRSAEDVATNLVYPVADSTCNKSKQVVPRAKNIRRMASLKKLKIDVIQAMQADALQRNPNNKRQTVVLIDGMPYLYKLVKKGLNEIKDYVVILDIIHVLEYLYLAAHSIYKENSKDAKKYVYKQLLGILNGRVGRVIGSMKQTKKKKNLTGNKLKSMEKVITYLSNHRKLMKYDEYLANGYPIGTGVVESACKLLVKKRMEGCGMRWSLEGAEAMLTLRSIETSNDWDEYHKFRIEQEAKRLYDPKQFHPKLAA